MKLTQKQVILSMLKDARLSGVNSYGKAREVALQLPYVIKQLRDEGYKIESRPKKDKSVDYILLFDPTEYGKPLKARPYTGIEEVDSLPQFTAAPEPAQERDLAWYDNELKRLREEYVTNIKDRWLIERQGKALKNARELYLKTHPQLELGEGRAEA